MGERMIDADELLRSLMKSPKIIEATCGMDMIDVQAVVDLVNNALTVAPEEIEPYSDKTIEILPHLTDSIVARQKLLRRSEKE